ncbi:hypothetical protein J6590_074886 [Homalodisca vitripennis]|nr:hypothetical protein J6590_074886 [Homalodisca vitripennis]
MQERSMISDGPLRFYGEFVAPHVQSFSMTFPALESTLLTFHCRDVDVQDIQCSRQPPSLAKRRTMMEIVFLFKLLTIQR